MILIIKAAHIKKPPYPRKKYNLMGKWWGRRGSEGRDAARSAPTTSSAEPEESASGFVFRFGLAPVHSPYKRLSTLLHGRCMGCRMLLAIMSSSCVLLTTKRMRAKHANTIYAHFAHPGA